MYQIILKDQLVAFEEKILESRKSLITDLKNINLQKDLITICFLHGWGSQKEVWQKLWDELTQRLQKRKQTLRFVALDFPPFGKSDSLKKVFDLEQYVKLTEAFLLKLNSDSLAKSLNFKSKIHLVAHSFGGRVAIKLLAKQAKSLDFSIYEKMENKELKTLEAMDKENLQKLQIGSLVLLGSAGFYDNSWQIKVQEFLAKLVSPLFKLPLLQSTRKKIYQILGSKDYVQLDGELKETFINIIKEDLTNELTKIQQPTLLIYGSKDQETPASFGQRMFKLIPNSELQVLEKLGHYSFVEDPVQIADLLVNFWQDKF